MKNLCDEKFEVQLKKLKEMAKVGFEIFTKLDLDEGRYICGHMLEPFRVIFIGDFNSGRSTAINALLGEKIIKTGVLPSTSVPVFIKHGKKKGAAIFFLNNPDENMFKYLPSDIVDHIKRHGGKEIPQMEVELEKVWEYIDYKLPRGFNDEDEYYEPLEVFEKVEVYIQDSIPEGLELIEIPGFRQAKIYSQKIISFFSSNDPDIIIFATRCECLFSLEERKTVQELNCLGYKNIFFLCNRLDLIGEEDQEAVKNYAKKYAEDKTEYGEDGVFFISSLMALNGKIKGDGDMVIASGINEVETSIKNVWMQHSLNDYLHKLMNVVKDTIYYKLPEKTNFLSSTLDGITFANTGIRYSLSSSKMYSDNIASRHKYFMYLFEEKLRNELNSRFDSLISSVPEFIERPDISKILDSARTMEQRRQAFEQVFDRAAEFAREKIMKSSDADCMFRDYVNRFIQDIDGSLNSLCTEIDRIYEAYDRILREEESYAEVGSMMEKVKIELSNLGSENQIPHIPMYNNVKPLNLISLMVIANPVYLFNPMMFGLELFNPVFNCSIFKKKVELKLVEILNSRRKDFSIEIITFVLSRFDEEIHKLLDFISKEIKMAEEKVDMIMVQKPEIEKKLSEMEDIQKSLAKLDEDILDMTFASMGL